MMKRIILTLMLAIFYTTGILAYYEDGYEEITTCYWKDGLAYRFVVGKPEMMFVDPVKYTQVHFDSFTWYGKSIYHHNEIYIASELTLDGVSYPVTKIDSGTANATYFKAINIPSSILEIGVGSFEHCWDLERVVFSENLKIIQENVLNDCPNLANINLPGSVEKFEDCFNNLSEKLVVVSAIAAPWKIDQTWNCFKRDDGKKSKIIVPAGCRQNYIDAGWELRFDEITENNESAIEEISGTTASLSPKYYDLTGREIDPARLDKGTIVIAVSDGKAKKIIL